MAAVALPPHPTPRTDSIISGPTSSHYLTSFYIYRAELPPRPRGCQVLDNVTFLGPTQKL